MWHFTSPVRFEPSRGRLTANQAVVYCLMRPLLVIVLDVLPHQIVEVVFAKDKEVVQALRRDRLNEPLDVGQP